jgi:UDP-N-acetylmuramoyl-tripeptide--D-alanyl-D-alanine ligase
MFKVKELLKATKGKLIFGNADVKINGISIDSRVIKPGEAFIAIQGNNFDGHNFIKDAIKKKAVAVICESSKLKDLSFEKTSFIVVKDTIKALGDIARFTRKKVDIPLIAVTGSNGKTTTKDMIAHVLSGKFKVLKNEGTKNNHIGLPLTLVNISKEYDFAVLEIGSNHFGEVSYLADICRPNIGVITNIGPSHLEHFHDLGGVFKEKITLLKYLDKPFVSILNYDDRFLKKESEKKTKIPLNLSIGIKTKSDFSASNILVINSKTQFLVNGKYKFVINTLGNYNIYNALAAIAIARLFGMEYEDISFSLTSFRFPKSRFNFVELNNIKFIDDTYNSNPNSLALALEALSKISTTGRKILVMGDMLELGSSKELLHRQAGKKAAKVCDVLITVGNLSRIAADMAKKSGFNTKNIFSCESALQAREILFKIISPVSEDVILVKGSRSMKMEEVFT